jgi:hypothetical protein
VKLEFFGGPKAGGWSAHGEWIDGDIPLAPCPFCGERINLVCENTHTPYYRVECHSCGADGPLNHEGDGWHRKMSRAQVTELHGASFDKAIADWNTRYKPQEGNHYG